MIKMKPLAKAKITFHSIPGLKAGAIKKYFFALLPEQNAAKIRFNHLSIQISDFDFIIIQIAQHPLQIEKALRSIATVLRPWIYFESKSALAKRRIPLPAIF